MKAIFKWVENPETGIQELEQRFIEQDETVPEGWTTDYDSVAPSQDPTEQSEINKSLLKQIAMLTAKVKQMGGK